MTSKQSNLQWLAGLMEGEGSFTIHHPKKEKDLGYPGAPKIQLKMTDRDVMERAAHIFGVKLYGPYKNNSAGIRKDYYLIQISTTLAVPWMKLLSPSLGERRKSRIFEILEYYNNNCKYRGWNGRGRYDPK